MSDIVKSLRTLSHPMAESLSDFERINKLCAAAFEASERIERLEGALVKTFNDWRDCELKIERMDAALSDMSQYISMADWQYLKPETKALL